MTEEEIAAALFLLLGMACIVAGVWLLAGMGWGMITLGICACVIGIKTQSRIIVMRKAKARDERPPAHQD